MIISIDKFYSVYSVDPNFDHIEYLRNYPETIDFYQPYCLNNNIDDQKRLYYHYSLYMEKYSLEHIKIFRQIFLDLIMTQEMYIKKYISTIFSKINTSISCHSYVDRQANLDVLEKLIPYLPPPTFTILDKYSI